MSELFNELKYLEKNYIDIRKQADKTYFDTHISTWLDENTRI